MNLNEFARSIDWALLRKQKHWLLKHNVPAANGLLGLLDCLQDAAVFSGVATAKEVFNDPQT